MLVMPRKTYCLFIILLLHQSINAQIECINGKAGIYPCEGMNLLAHMPMSDIGGGSGNDIWGWKSPTTKKEYVLMGRTTGTAFVDISDPVNPIYLGNLPTHTSNSTWRDIKVFNSHAFIVSEAPSHGMQVFDLFQLDTVTTPPITFSSTAHFEDAGLAGQVSDSHNIVINEESGYAYLVGANLCNGGLVVVDINNPVEPTYAGCYSSSGYTHDAQCVNYIGPDTDYASTEICFNSNGSGGFVIVDVTDKTDMTLISATQYNMRQYTHQGWLTEDQEYFLMNDELDESRNGHNTRTHIWNVRDLDSPIYMGYYESTLAAIDHNLYIRGNLTFQSNYRGGLRILDISNISNADLEEIAYFDTFPNGDGASFSGTWSNYPYFDSGVIAVSNFGEGLFLVKEQDCVDIQLKVVMEGTYDVQIGEMENGLSVRGLLPGQTPVSGLAIATPAGQPYTANTWNYGGTEGRAWTDIDYGTNTIDWVLVSFRTGQQKNTEIAMTAALISKDGSIDFPKRCALPELSNVDSVYVVVEHRNHIGVMSPQAIPIVGGVLTYDFSLEDSYKDITSFGQKQLSDGTWVMYAGDGEQDDFPSYDITGGDKTIWVDSNGDFDKYQIPDYNLDGDVNGADKSLWDFNNGVSSRVPK